MTGPSPVRIAARTASSASRGGLLVAGVDRGEERGVLAEARDVGEADGGVDVVGLAAAAAAELHHHEAERADVDRLDHAAAGHLAADGRFGEVLLGRVEQVGRAAELDHHVREALGRGARVQRRVDLGVDADQLERGARELQRDLDQPRLARAVAQDVDRLAHLERVAGRAAEHLVHVGQQRRARQAGALGDLGDRAAQLGRLLARGHERARAGLDVHDQAVEPLGQLLGEDRGDDQRDRLDGAGGVAQRVQPPVGGRELGGLADDRAARVSDDRAEALELGARVVAGDRVELVERAAGVAEPAARDHRDERAAGGEQRREDQRDLVADAAGRVLVEHRAVEVPRQDRAGVAHRLRERHALGRLEVAEEDRHRERGGLAVGDAAVGDALDEEAQLVVGERAAVALAPDQLLGEERRHCVPTQRRSSGPSSARSALALLERLLVRQRDLAHALGEVGDDGHRRDPQPAVARDDRLRDRAHPDEVGAHRAVRADLGGRLEARAGDREVDAVVQRGAELVGHGVQAGAQLGVVGVGQAREARADLVVVEPHERVEALHVDVVGQRDEAAGAGLGPQRAGRVGEHEDLRAEQPQRADRGRDGGRLDPLVDVRAALEAGDGDAVERAERERAGVARDRADAEAGDVGVGDRDRVGELVDERAEAGAEHEPDARREARRALLDRPGGVVHPRLSGPKDSGSSSASDVVRRTRSHVGEVDRRVGRGELAQPLAAAAARRALLLARRGDDDLHDPPAATGHHRAERGGLRALALGVGGVLDVGARVAAAVVGQHRGADGEVGVRRVGAAGGFAGEAKQLGIGRRVADRVGVRALAELLDAELCAKAARSGRARGRGPSPGRPRPRAR